VRGSRQPENLGEELGGEWMRFSLISGGLGERREVRVDHRSQ
jgi:hypothetical protein